MRKNVLSVAIILMTMTACGKNPVPITEQFQCDDGNRFTLTHTPSSSIPATLIWQGKTYEMASIKTTTGAERYEHPSGMTYIGAANSSMLIDRKQGKLIVQDCRNPSQAKIQKDLAGQKQ